MYLPIEEIQSNSNKIMRIESLQPMIKNHYIKFSRKHKTLLQQLKEFPMGKNDDGPDALKMAVDTSIKARGSSGAGEYQTAEKEGYSLKKERTDYVKKEEGKERQERSLRPGKDTGILRPVDMTIAAGEINDRYSDYPSRGLNPVKLASILRDADEGNVRSQMELFEEMEEKDAHLFSQMQTRKLAVTGLDWEVQPFSPDDEQDQGHSRVDQGPAPWHREPGRHPDRPAGRDREGREHHGDHLGRGLRRLRCDRRYPVCTSEETGVGLGDGRHAGLHRTVPERHTPAEEQIVVHRYKAKSGHPSRAGIMRIVSWMYLFKNYTVKDWVSFCEVYGMPCGSGKYDPGASEADKQELLDAIVRIGSDAAGIIPETTMIEFKEANKTTSADIYEQLARYCRRTDQQGDPGTDTDLRQRRWKLRPVQDPQRSPARSDRGGRKALAVTIRRDIIRPLVEYNFGEMQTFRLSGLTPMRRKTRRKRWTCTAHWCATWG